MEHEHDERVFLIPNSSQSTVRDHAVGSRIERLLATSEQKPEPNSSREALKREVLQGFIFDGAQQADEVRLEAVVDQPVSCPTPPPWGQPRIKFEPHWCKRLPNKRRPTQCHSALEHDGVH